ncbi:competence protein CoiA family protein [Lactobacillus sp. ESL0684]|nr:MULTISPECIES: competence protein CoiA family protein [unclassified Lactobacillus]WEV40409.1 competence protein CoiA family protein [Lactobacillus sp. ESL0681]WEV43142.1 competence protein CoiA family protein [Lactobacillus sp. ESL0684]
MYAALLNDKLVLAVAEAQLIKQHAKKIPQPQYFCPKCYQEVQLVTKVNQPYFKHFAQNNKSLGEKAEHAQSKRLLQCGLVAAGFKTASQEISLAQGRLRADVLANSQLAFEVQCAPLSSREFAHRHALYQQIKICDVWIVGKRHFLKHKIKKSQLIYFRKNQLWHDYYLEVDPSQEILRLKYNILLEPLVNELHYQTQEFRLTAQGLQALWQFSPELKHYKVDQVRQKNYLQNQLNQKTKVGLEIATQLYQQRLTVADLPTWVFHDFRQVTADNNITKYLKSIVND